MTAHYDGQAPLRLAIQSNLEQRAFKNRVSPITLLISSHFVRSTQKSTTNWGDFFDKFRQWFCKCIYYCSRWSSFVPIKDEITICILTFSRLFLSKNGSILGARQLFEKAIKLIFFRLLLFYLLFQHLLYGDSKSDTWSLGQKSVLLFQQKYWWHIMKRQLLRSPLSSSWFFHPKNDRV